jgi:hypothetical protein
MNFLTSLYVDDSLCGGFDSKVIEEQGCESSAHFHGLDESQSVCTHGIAVNSTVNDIRKCITKGIPIEAPTGTLAAEGRHSGKRLYNNDASGAQKSGCLSNVFDEERQSKQGTLYFVQIT